MGKSNDTLKQNDSILNLLMSGGMIKDLKIPDEKIRNAQQKKRQQAFHNTELLLRHYRSIAWLLECFPDTIAKELEESFTDLDSMINRLDVEMARGNKKIERRLESIEKTRLIVDKINEALTVLKKKPDDGEIMYEVIRLTYIEPETLNHNELLFRLNLSSRHYYRIREQAISIISIRLWSSPSKEIDIWLEMLSMLEQTE